MITVHDRELCRELLGYEEKEEEEEDGEERKMVGPSRSYSESQFSEGAALTRSTTHSQLIKAQEWLSRKARRTIVALPTEPEVKSMQTICDSMDREREEIFRDVEEYLSSDSHYKHCKKEMLYQKWKEQVFVPLHSAIKLTLESTHSFNDAQLRQLFNQYLQIQNKKTVFLDTITVGEYNPMRLHYISARAQTPGLRDPLLSQQRDHCDELTVMNNCDVGVPPDRSHDLKATPPGRTDTNPVQWLAMKLIQIDSENSLRSRRRVRDYQAHTHFIGGSTIVNNDDNTSDLQVPHKTPLRYQRKDKLSLKWSD